MLRAWRKFRDIPPATRRLAIEASGWLLLARVTLSLVPFAWITRAFGGLHPPTSDESRLSQDSASATEIGRVVERTADVLGCGLVCLPRALAASQMLALRGVSTRLHFGAARPEPGKKMVTHAWLETHGAAVTGYPLAREFVEVGYFVR